MALPAIGGPVIRPGMRAAGLSRLSRETQETTSPERQRELHLRLARNYELIYDPKPYGEGGDLYEDIDFSAYNLSRPRARVRGADGPAARLRRDHDLGAAPDRAPDRRASPGDERVQGARDGDRHRERPARLVRPTRRVHYDHVGRPRADGPPLP